MAGRTVVRVGERELSLSQPRQGAVPGDRHDQGRGDPLLRPHRADDAAAPRRSVHHAEALPQRRASRPGFFEKRCPKHRPEWVPTAPGPGDHDGDIGYCRFDEPASLVWAANMAALELHVPMAVVRRPRRPADRRVRLRPGRAGSDQGVLRDRPVGARGARRRSASRDGARRRARRACRCTCR